MPSNHRSRRNTRKSKPTCSTETGVASLVSSTETLVDWESAGQNQHYTAAAIHSETRVDVYDLNVPYTQMSSDVLKTLDAMLSHCSDKSSQSFRTFCVQTLKDTNIRMNRSILIMSFFEVEKILIKNLYDVLTENQKICDDLVTVCREAEDEKKRAMGPMLASFSQAESIKQETLELMSKTAGSSKNADLVALKTRVQADLATANKNLELCRIEAGLKCDEVQKLARDAFNEWRGNLNNVPTQTVFLATPTVVSTDSVVRQYVASGFLESDTSSVSVLTTDAALDLLVQLSQSGEKVESVLRVLVFTILVSDRTQPFGIKAVNTATTTILRTFSSLCQFVQIWKEMAPVDNANLTLVLTDSIVKPWLASRFATDSGITALFWQTMRTTESLRSGVSSLISKDFDVANSGAYAFWTALVSRGSGVPAPDNTKAWSWAMAIDGVENLRAIISSSKAICQLDSIVHILDKLAVVLALKPRSEQQARKNAVSDAVRRNTRILPRKAVLDGQELLPIVDKSDVDEVDKICSELKIQFSKLVKTVLCKNFKLLNTVKVEEDSGITQLYISGGHLEFHEIDVVRVNELIGSFPPLVCKSNEVAHLCSLLRSNISKYSHLCAAATKARSDYTVQMKCVDKMQIELQRDAKSPAMFVKKLYAYDSPKTREMQLAQWYDSAVVLIALHKSAIAAESAVQKCARGLAGLVQRGIKASVHRLYAHSTNVLSVMRGVTESLHHAANIDTDYVPTSELSVAIAQLRERCSLFTSVPSSHPAGNIVVCFSKIADVLEKALELRGIVAEYDFMDVDVDVAECDEDDGDDGDENVAAQLQSRILQVLASKAVKNMAHRPETAATLIRTYRLTHSSVPPSLASHPLVVHTLLESATTATMLKNLIKFKPAILGDEAMFDLFKAKTGVAALRTAHVNAKQVLRALLVSSKSVAQRQPEHVQCREAEYEDWRDEMDECEDADDNSVLAELSRQRELATGCKTVSEPVPEDFKDKVTQWLEKVILELVTPVVVGQKDTCTLVIIHTTDHSGYNEGDESKTTVPDAVSNWMLGLLNTVAIKRAFPKTRIVMECQGLWYEVDFSHLSVLQLISSDMSMLLKSARALADIKNRNRSFYGIRYTAKSHFAHLMLGFPVKEHVANTVIIDINGYVTEDEKRLIQSMLKMYSRYTRQQSGNGVEVFFTYEKPTAELSNVKYLHIGTVAHEFARYQQQSAQT